MCLELIGRDILTIQEAGYTSPPFCMWENRGSRLASNQPKQLVMIEPQLKAGTYNANSADEPRACPEGQGYGDPKFL